MTVSGIGKLNGAMILDEIGNIKRFSHSSKLPAYAGLDPVVNQSGKFNARKTRMSEHGSKLLRYALINATSKSTLNIDGFNVIMIIKLLRLILIIRLWDTLLTNL